MATPRLQRYLATLERRPFETDLERVAAAIRSLGVPVEDWILGIHEQFAGYVEPLGSGEEAVYGIYHPRSKWLAPRGIDGDDTPGDWWVSCADAHPSFDFGLYCDRSFLGHGSGGSSDSFERKLEKDALWHEFAAGARVQYVLSHLRGGAKALAEEIVERLQPEPDLASDSFDTFFWIEDVLIRKSSEDRDIVAIRSAEIPSWMPAKDCYLVSNPWSPGARSPK